MQQITEVGTKGKIFILDDETIVHNTLKRLLENKGYVIDSALTPEEALANIDKSYDLLICDLRMPGLDGVEVLKQIRQRGINIQVIMLTGFATLESATESDKYGALAYLFKPIEDINAFIEKVGEAVTLSCLKKDIEDGF